jgi:hypothetical protein
MTGVFEALAACVVTTYVDEGTTEEQCRHHWAVRALDALLDGSDDVAQQCAVRAGALDAMVRKGAQNILSASRAAHARLLSLLEAAAQRHDAAVCEHEGCKRCAAARDAGRVCALPGCGARKRADGSGKGLLRCGACRRFAFCGPAHQREAWAGHKDKCAALAAAAAAAAGAAGGATSG